MKTISSFLLLLCCHSALLFCNDDCWQNPWGKDACLATRQKPVRSNGECAPTPLAKIGAILIRFHQNVISPIDGPRSHYRPSSSQYTLDAMRCYGFLSGVALGCDRLLRENDEEWVYPTIEECGKSIKWDPVNGCPPPCHR